MRKIFIFIFIFSLSFLLISCDNLKKDEKKEKEINISKEIIGYWEVSELSRDGRSLSVEEGTLSPNTTTVSFFEDKTGELYFDEVTYDITWSKISKKTIEVYFYHDYLGEDLTSKVTFKSKKEIKVIVEGLDIEIIYKKITDPIEETTKPEVTVPFPTPDTNEYIHFDTYLNYDGYYFEMYTTSNYPFELVMNTEQNMDYLNVKSTNHFDNSESKLRINALYNIEIRFEYLVASEDGCDLFSVRKNGDEIFNASGHAGGVEYIQLQVGEYLEFIYSKDSSYSSGDDCVYLNGLNIYLQTEVQTPVPSVPPVQTPVQPSVLVPFYLNSFGEGTAFNVYTTENYPFEITNYEGNYIFLRSTNHDDASTSILRIEAQQDITLSFNYTISSESGYDYYVLYINDVEIERLSGENSSSYFANLSAGEYLEIVYSKDSSYSFEFDCVYINNLVILPRN